MLIMYLRTMAILKVQDESLRPREKIQALGVTQLTTEELLLTILGSGNRKGSLASVVHAITQLLPSKNITLANLRSIPGVGLAKACQVLAVLEFVDRLRPLGAPIIDSTEKVLETVSELRSASREMVVGLYLNSRLQLIRKELLAVGSMNEAVIHPRDIFSAVTTQPVQYLILCHNHPSGVVDPSASDIALTKRVLSAGELLGVQLLDHVIVSATSEYSFRSHGHIKKLQGGVV